MPTLLAAGLPAEAEPGPILPPRRARRGASAIEYAALLSLIVVAVVAAVQYLGSAASSTYSRTATGAKAPSSSSNSNSGGNGSSRPRSPSTSRPVSSGS